MPFNLLVLQLKMLCLGLLIATFRDTYFLEMAFSPQIALGSSLRGWGVVYVSR